MFDELAHSDTLRADDTNEYVLLFTLSVSVSLRLSVSTRWPQKIESTLFARIFQKNPSPQSIRTIFDTDQKYT